MRSSLSSGTPTSRVQLPLTCPYVRIVMLHDCMQIRLRFAPLPVDTRLGRSKVEVVGTERHHRVTESDDPEQRK